MNFLQPVPVYLTMSAQYPLLFDSKTGVVGSCELGLAPIPNGLELVHYPTAVYSSSYGKGQHKPKPFIMRAD